MRLGKRLAVGEAQHEAQHAAQREGQREAPGVERDESAEPAAGGTWVAGSAATPQPRPAAARAHGG